MGDLHGDYNLTIKMFKLEKLIDDNENWIGGDTFVVQVGDQLDNCRPFKSKCDEYDEKSVSPYSLENQEEAEDIKVMKLLTKLNEQAQSNIPEGAVISLLGNHEMMN